MKLWTLKTIVEHHAYQLKEGAGYAGAHNDGGSGSLLAKLEKFKQQVINENDFRPSERVALDNVEVGEPVEFSESIEIWRKHLARKNTRQ